MHVYTPSQSMFNTWSAKPVTIYACVGVRRKAREIESLSNEDANVNEDGCRSFNFPFSFFLLV